MDGDAHNNVVQVVVEQVRQGFCHDLFLAHSLETVPFPLDLLEAFIYFLLLAVRLALLSLLGLGAWLGLRGGRVLWGLWYLGRLGGLGGLGRLWDFGGFRLLGFLGLCCSASLFGWSYEARPNSIFKTLHVFSKSGPGMPCPIY